MATEVATLTFKANTQEIEAAHQELVKLNKQGKITDKTLKDFEKSMAGALKPTKQMPGALGNVGKRAGQAGIQFQQLVGQVQAGTSPMIALSQQAADLGFVLGFPLLGAVAGITASLAGPLISALIGSSNSVEDMRKSAEELAETVNDLTGAQREYFALLDQRQQDKLREEVEDLQASLDALNQSVNDISQSYIAMESFTDSSTQANAEHNEETLKLQATIDNLNQKIAKLQGNIDKYTGATIEETDAQKQAREEIERFIGRVQEQTATFGKSRAEVLLYNASLLNLTPAQQAEVEILAELIAKKDADAQATRDQARAERELTKAIREERAKRAAEEQEVNKRVQEMNAAENELRAAGLLDVERDEIDSFNRRQAKLDEFRQKQLISEQQYTEGSKNLERQRNEFAIKSAGDALNQLGQVNKTAFKAAKAYNIGQAIMNTYTGATKALAELPPPLNFIVAAATVASGLAQVQQIRSQQYSGRALGGQVRGGESYVVGERGPEVLTMGSTGRIIPNDKIGGTTQTNNQNVSVSFNITATDASGFDQLLQARRGMIIGMINQAMNNRGRKALV